MTKTEQQRGRRAVWEVGYIFLVLVFLKTFAGSACCYVVGFAAAAFVVRARLATFLQDFGQLVWGFFLESEVFF